MRSSDTRRLIFAALTLCVCWTLPMGCGSGKTEEGGQINVTIPKEQADKQKTAFQDYQKQQRANPKASPK